jgi:hypothetical protein
MGTWLDPDGLFRKIGTDKATPNKAGEYKTYGGMRTIEILNLDLTTLTTTPVIISDQTFYPKLKVDSVEVLTNTAATTGTSAALDIGLIQTDRTTVVDADGILDSLAVTAISAAGEKTITSGDPAAGGVGAFAATAPTVPGYITAATSTGTFTAGNVTIRIHYRAV